MRDLFQFWTKKSLPSVTLNTAASDEVLAVISNPGFDWLLYEFEVATQALDNFDVFGRVQAVAAAQIKDFTIDWTVDPPTGHRIKEYTSTGTGENLSVTPAGGHGYFLMRVSGLAEITIKGSAAVNGAVVSQRYSLRNGL